MDIMVKTKGYTFAFDGQFAIAISMYLLDVCKTKLVIGKKVKITRTEVKNLLSYINNHPEMFLNSNHQANIYSDIESAYLIMSNSEKMIISGY